MSETLALGGWSGSEDFRALSSSKTQFKLDAFSTPKLKSDLEKMRTEWLRAKLDLEEAQVSCCRLQERLEEDSILHAKTITDIEASHRAQIEATLSRHKLDLESVNLKYRDELNEITKQYQEEGIELKKNFDIKTTELNRQHEAELEEALRVAKRAQGEAKEVTTLMKSEVERLEALLSDSKKEVETLRQRLNVMCADKETKLAMSRISQLESEVSSLRSVLEIKSAELQDQRRKSEGWRRDADQLPPTLTRVATLQARMEDLQVRLEAKEAHEQKLLEENRKFQDLLGEECKQKKRLSLHVEELQWRLRQNSEVTNALAAAICPQTQTPSLQNGSPISGVKLPRSPKSSLKNILSPRHTDIEINGARIGGGDSVGDVNSSPPTSPKVKGVVEKNDSVAWVLDMEEPPEYVASRILRRAQSLRGYNGGTPVTTPTHHVAKGNPPRKSSSSASIIARAGKRRSQGRRSSTSTREDEDNEEEEEEEEEEGWGKEEVILVGSGGGEGGRRAMVEIWGGGEEIEIEAGGDREGDEESRAMIRRVGGGGNMASSGGGGPKEAAGEAMVSGEASEDEEDDDDERKEGRGLTGADDEDDDDSSPTSTSPSSSCPSSPDLIQAKSRLLRSSNSPLDLSWSEVEVDDTQLSALPSSSEG